MRKTIAAIIISLLSTGVTKADYTPTEENLKARKEFSHAGFGIFLHWGIYSMFGQGEWYLNSGKLNAEEYAKVASGFYPAKFDAASWVKDIKESGARYITITSRHHDGFSMWKTACSDYNIVDATPFGRDVLKELAEECQKQGITLNFYYSHLDWTRPDYPLGRTGLNTGRPTDKQNWNSYFKFMNDQLTELLTNYGPVGAIWFDGFWDHDEDATPFDWHLTEQYALIHKLQPGCLIGNNHHVTVHEGEDIQIFERDVPGENKAGLSGQEVSRLPLETCQTMNGMWGYKVSDQNYKSTRELIHLLLNTASKGANLLLNIGPQPNGELPATARERLKEIGNWMKTYGETFYATTAGDFPAQEWGVATRKGNKLYLHVITPQSETIDVPVECKVKKATDFLSRADIKYSKKKEGGISIKLDSIPAEIDYVIELETK